MPTCETEDDDPAKPQTPTTPQRSPAVRHPRNGSGDGKAAANKAAGPSNAPGRRKAGGKKPEPTLLTDFLLGRPSVNRVRRRSSAVAPPAEFKASAVNKLQPPGGVKYRVKQWQQSSAAAVIEDPAAPTKKPDGEYLNSDVENEQQPPAEPHLAVKPEKRKNASPLPPRARGTPRKRVVSDSHWVRNRKKSPQTKQNLLLNLIVDPVAVKKSPTTKAADNGKRLPKDFVKSNWANPPLERKIQDWAARIDGPQAASHSGTTEDVADTLPISLTSSSAMKAETPVKKAKTPTKAKTPEKLDKSKRLPKDFVKSNWTNPPLERKIQDWAERTAKHNEIPDEENPEEQSEDKLDEKPREKPEEETESISDTILPAKPTNLKKTPAKKSKPIKPKSSPKEFVENLLAKPPLERKIQGWMGLTDKLNDNMRGEKSETVVYRDLSGPAKSTTLKRGPAGRKSKPKGLPKDFVESNWANPPLERKMQDWVARVNGHDTVPHDEEATELVPDLPTNPSNLNSKSVTSTRSPNGIRKGYVEANSVNPAFERKIQDWVARTNDSDIAPHEERSKVTPRKVSRHVKDGKSSEVQKSTGEAEPRGVAGAKEVARENPLSQPPAPSNIDSAIDIRPMSQNQVKEEAMGNARENNPKRNRSKSKIGRRGAIHGTVRPNAKRFDYVQDQDTTKQGDDINSQLQSPVDRDRERRLAKEENARRQDRLANNKDPTRSRDLRTLAPLKVAQIDQTRQVKAKEYFHLDLRHSNGQRMACEVELIVRDSDHDAGDILICEVNARRCHYLLFQPLLTEQISVRRGDMEDDLIVMARGQDGTTDWQECFLLKAEHGEVVEEFMVMFSDKPVPPAISRFDPELLEYDSPGKALMSGALVCPDSPDVPIGEHAGFRDQTHQASPKAVDPFVSGDGNSKERADYRLSLTPTQRDRAIEHVSPQTTPTRYRPRSKELSLATPTKAYPNQASNEKSVSQSTLIAPGPSATEPPPPPPHKQKSTHDVATEFESSHSASYELKHRRSSSPLKHEYQPSDYTTSSSTSYVTDSEDDDSTLESSGDGLAGTEEIASQLQQVNDAVLPDICLEPPQTSYCLKFKAHISCWRVPPGRWDNIHLNLCTIVITPGLIEAYPLDAFDASSTDSSNDAKPSGRPLIALVLTPIVMLRQSNPLDIEIHSQPLETSLLKSTHIVRFRSRNRSECMAAYAAAHKARQDNEKYNLLQRDRVLNDYDGQAGNEWDERKARYSWFGRKKSYRASARASSFSGSDGSTFSLGRTAFMALRRMSNGANGRLTPDMSRFEGSGPKSRGSSIFGTTDSAPSSSRRTRTDSSMAASGTGNTSVFDTNNLIIRVYRSGIAPRWMDLGYCRIVIGVPQPGAFPDTRLDYGVLKQVTLTQHTVERPKLLDKHLDITNPPKESKEQVVFFDGICGARRFTRVNRIGIVMNVEEEVVGPNGEIGMPGAVGGIGTRQRKWMFKCSNSTQAGWIFALLGGGV